MASPDKPTDDPTFVVPFIIDGRDYFPERTFQVTSPATAKVSHLCGSATVSDAELAVQAATKAFETWRTTRPAFRRDIFLRAAEIMESRRDDLARYMTSETGADSTWSRHNVSVAVDLIRDAAGRIATLEGTFPVTEDADVSAIVMQEPYGVVLSIAPWNAPYILGARSVLGPVAAGNTVVLKASELAPRVMHAIVAAFNDAGLPAGVMNMIAHEPQAAASVTAALIAHPSIKKINFTGSTAVGRIIGKLAAEQVKPVVLELGGKASSIVWSDADMELAADQCALGSFANAGQICMATERIVIHEAVKDVFKEKFFAAIGRRFPSADAFQPVINDTAASKVQRLIDDAVEKGASLAFGMTSDTVEQPNPRRKLPQVLDNVTSEMDIYLTESFGPVVSLFYVNTEEEALRLANDTEYGLTAAVFTEDLRRGLRFARQLETGAVHINGMTIHDEANLPHGGVKASGHGRFNSSLGLGEWVRTKTVTFRH